VSVRIGIDLGGTKTSGVVLDDGGTELVRRRVPTPRGDYVGTLEMLASLVGELEAQVGAAPGEAPVGVGAPGTWQPRQERMKNCNSTWLNDRPLLHDLRLRLGDRVRLANDADCLALSEAVDGAGAGFETVFAVILGTGVGGGVVAHGRLLQGPNGLAGEWGHTPLPYFRQHVRRTDDPAEAARFRLESGLADRQCYCGRINCIETFLSGPGLAETHAALGYGVADAEDIAGRRSTGAEASWGLYLHMLARSLAQVVNVLDPAVIVIGGGVSQAPSLCRELAGRLPASAFSSVDGRDVRVEVRSARWGDDSGVRGAARLRDATSRN
jgi:fructokinase